MRTCFGSQSIDRAAPTGQHDGGDDIIECFGVQSLCNKIVSAFSFCVARMLTSPMNGRSVIMAEWNTLLHVFAVQRS